MAVDQSTQAAAETGVTTLTRTRQNADMADPVSTADFLARVSFDANGLIPAVAQESATGEVLMLAWMSAESLRLTLETGTATYFSRSRQKLWRKGETSGHVQTVTSVRLDCDGDALLLLVDQIGPACHTGLHSCFDTVTTLVVNQ